jgi:hypothetical protein
MNAALLSDITHIASRLQSAGMQHEAASRAMLDGARKGFLCNAPQVEEHAAAAKSIADLAERLSFKVGQLKSGLGDHVVRKSLLMPNITLGARAHESVTLLATGMLADSEGGCTE